MEACNPARFARLNAVQELMKQVQPPDGESDTPEEVEAYLNFLFSAYCMWRRGEVTQLNKDDLQGPPSDTDTAATERVIYAQLPERTVWSQVNDGGPHEPMDGLFVSTLGGNAFTLAVLGMHESRAGFSQVAATASMDDLAACRSECRSEPFAPAMDGGAEAGFLSVTRTAELLLLAKLALQSDTG